MLDMLLCQKFELYAFCLKIMLILAVCNFEAKLIMVALCNRADHYIFIL